MDVLILVACSVFVGLSLSVAGYFLIVNRANKKVIDNLNKDIEGLLAKVAQAKIESSNGFTKFLSESREEAFNYIEDVQSAIEELRLATFSRDDKKIKEACNKVISYLPENNN